MTCRRSKYNNIKTVVDGVLFDSKMEAARYQYLKLRYLAGEITHLEPHPAWDLDVNGYRIGRYTADFIYIENGKAIVEDVKGFRTADYVLRKKLMKAIHGIDIVEITK